MSLFFDVTVAIVLLLALVFGADLAYKTLPKFHDYIDAHFSLLVAQAKHVEATAKAEWTNLDTTLKAFELQGRNKLRSELAAAKGDLARLEAALGLKLSTIGVQIVPSLPFAIAPEGSITSVSPINPAGPGTAGSPTPGATQPN